MVEIEIDCVIPQRLGKRSPFDAFKVLFKFSLMAGEKKPCFMVPSIRFTKETMAKFFKNFYGEKGRIRPFCLACSGEKNSPWKLET